jgi:hypothetical protein
MARFTSQTPPENLCGLKTHKQMIKTEERGKTGAGMSCVFDNFSRHTPRYP